MKPPHVAIVAMVLFAACNAGTEQAEQPSTSSGPRRFGAAEVAPPNVHIGDQFTITPDGEVQPVCLGVAMVLQETTSGQKRVGILSPDGSWQSDATGPDPTVAACLPSRTAEAQSYEVPPEMDGGDYLVCLTWEQTEAGCGSLIVDD